MDKSKMWLRLIFVILFSCFLFAIGVLLLVLKRPTYSDRENRELAKFPQIVSSDEADAKEYKYSVKDLLEGKFTMAIMQHYNDTIPMRDEFDLMTSKLKSFNGIEVTFDQVLDWKPKEDDPKPTVEPTPIVTQDPLATEDPNATPTQVPTATPTPEPEEQIDINGLGLVDNGKRGLELYGGLESYMDKYIASVNMAAKMLPDVQVYSMSIPTACEFYWDRLKYGKADSQVKHITYIRNNLSKDVKEVYIVDVLAAHKSEEIYLRTDHHWTYLGAYYAAKEFANVAGFGSDFTDISKFTPKSVPDYLGSLYKAYGLTQLAKYPEVFKYYITPKTYSIEYYNTNFVKVNVSDSMYTSQSVYNSYSICVGGDYYVPHVYNTGAGTGRVLVIFKDSYGDPLIQYLLDGFDEIYVFDCRHFTFDKEIYSFLEELGTTDLLFATGMFVTAGSTSKVYYNRFVNNTTIGIDYTTR